MLCTAIFFILLKHTAAECLPPARWALLIRICLIFPYKVMVDRLASVNQYVLPRAESIGNR